MKEIKLRPAIGQHDLQTKIKQIRKFCKKEDRIKVLVQFKGREIVHENLGSDLLDKVAEDLSDVVRVESRPPLKGNVLIMILRSLCVEKKQANQDSRREQRRRNNRRK